MSSFRRVPWILVLGLVACSESGDDAASAAGNDGGAGSALDDDATSDDDDVTSDDDVSSDDDDTADDDSGDGDSTPDDVADDDVAASDDDVTTDDDVAPDDVTDDDVSQDDDAAPDDDDAADDDVAASDDDVAPDDDVAEDDDSATPDDDVTDDDAPVSTDLLAEAYPGDLGLGDNPAVIWFEDFEEGSLEAIAARYEQSRDNGRWELVTDTPNGSGYALEMRAGQGEEAVDLYKQLPDSDEWYVRWYARYEAGVPWHHSGMWFGGYNPSSPWPDPNAGLRPNGDDRFSIAIEPVWEGPRLDTYNYWMGMHSWQEEPINDDGTAYYGNAVIHRNEFTVDEGEWMCLEVHLRLNSDPESAAGAMLEVWKNDELVASFDENGPLGYWIRDKFCPEGVDGTECTNYPAPATDVLDLRFRNTTDLRLNAFWPQNYITADAQGTLGFDQMVVASTRIGCLR